MRSAASFLYVSLPLMGSCAMAVSASNPRFCIQFLSLVCMLYLGPFSSRDISVLENEMSVWLTTLGWNVCFSCGVCVCVWKSFSSFLFRDLYLFRVSFWSLQLLSECMAMCSPMCGLSVGVIGKVVGLVVASCCVGILSRL